MVEFGSSQYKTFSAERWRYQGVATMSMLRTVSADAEVRRVDKFWMTNMIRRGVVITRPPDGNHYVVAGTNNMGAVLWRVTQHVKTDSNDGSPLSCFVMEAPENHEGLEMFDGVLEFAPIDTDEWEVSDVSVVHPLDLPSCGVTNTDGLEGSCVMVATGFQPLLEYSALSGFQGLTSSLLQKLARDHLELKFARGQTPKNFMQWLDACLRAVLPDASDEEINAIIESRLDASEPDAEVDGAPDVMGGFIDKTSKDMFEGPGEEDDMEDIEEMKIKRRKHAAHAARRAKAKASAKPAEAPIANVAPPPEASAGNVASGSQPTSSGSNAEPPAQRVPRPRVPIPEELQASDFQPFLPQLKGCTIAIERKWHHRCKVRYPASLPPWSFSKVFSIEIPASAESAILECLQWAWRRHGEERASQGLAEEPCPWDLTSASCIM